MGASLRRGGAGTAFALYALTALVSGCIGVFLVYLQHNFEDTYWDHKPDHDYERATLQGSSALDLGHWWDIGTGNIAITTSTTQSPHPLYRLRKCHRALREHVDMRTIEWPEALRSFNAETLGRRNPAPRAVSETQRRPPGRGAGGVTALVFRHEPLSRAHRNAEAFETLWLAGKASSTNSTASSGSTC